MIPIVAFPPERLLNSVNGPASPTLGEGLCALDWIFEERALLLELSKRSNGVKSRFSILKPEIRPVHFSPPIRSYCDFNALCLCFEMFPEGYVAKLTKCTSQPHPRAVLGQMSYSLAAGAALGCYAVDLHGVRDEGV